MNGDNDLGQFLKNHTDNKMIFGAVMHVCNDNKEFLASSGTMQPDKPYFIASITKLYITAIFLQWKNCGIISINDSIADYLPQTVMHELHLLKDKDYSRQITIGHLLSQTSGLPDYFEDKIGNDSLLNKICRGEDQAWTFDDTISRTKQMKTKFAPGSPHKAHYSDTNYQLLGKIIEVISEKTLQDVLDDLIVKPLGLMNTWLYLDPNDTRPAPIYYKQKPMTCPLAMASFGADGGIVSTAEESMRFLKAFFGGQFFPQKDFDAMKNWNNIMFPLQYGMGLMRFKLPRIFSPFKAMPEFLGHSGLSGAVAFYIPEKNIWITGTINQVANPGLSFRLMIKLLNNLE